MNVVARYNPARSVQRYNMNEQLGPESSYEIVYDGLGGFSLRRIVGNIGSTIKKAVVDTGHAVGTVATSKIGQGIIAGGLALTGVGLPAAAAIGAASKGVGNLIKPGGNLGTALTGTYQGALTGAAGSLVGTGARAGIGGLLRRGATDAAGSLPSNVTSILSGKLPDMAVTPSANDINTSIPNTSVDASALDPMNPQGIYGRSAGTAAAIADAAARRNRSAPGSLADLIGKKIDAAISPLASAIPGANIITAGVDAAKASAASALDTANTGIAAASAAQKVADKARAAQKRLQAKVSQLSDQLKLVQDKADAAAKAGDALGAGTFAEQARKLSETVAAVQSAASNAGDMAARGANAVQGAVTGATAGFAAPPDAVDAVASIGSALKNPTVIIALGVGTAMLFGNRSTSRGRR